MEAEILEVEEARVKLIVEIDVESSDLEEADIDELIREAQRGGSSITVEVGSAIEGERSVYRASHIVSEYFKLEKK